jgi:hypothetical protein
MNSLPCLAALIVTAAAVHAEVPKVLSALPEGKLVKGATIQVVPPAELEPYLAKVEAASKKDPEWFQEHSKKSSPGVPLPYDPKLGLTEEEYAEYLKIWEKREFKAVEPIVLQLKKSPEGTWAITTAGGAFAISTLKYDAAKDIFVSPNGEMKRLEDVKAEKHSILGAWEGAEWKFEEENTLGKIKENFAIGKTSDGKFGMLVYRMQEVSSEGTPIYDKSIVIRFPMGEAGLLKPEDMKPR